MKIVISSGHGKYVSGASSIINEVTEARKIVDRVTEYLKELSCTVYEFHDNTSKNQDDNINTIVRYHNSKSRDLDVSVHLNAASKTNDPRGVEVLYVSDSGKAIAAKVSTAIAKASGLKNRGAKKRSNLGFLNGTNKPAILIEVCFVDSKADVEIYKCKFDEICRTIAETVSGKKFKDKTIVKESAKQVSVKIQTGGLNPDTIKEVSEFLIAQKWYASIQFSNDGTSPIAVTGGLSDSMQKEFRAWLDNRGWWYKIV